MAEALYHLLANPSQPLFQGVLVSNDDDPMGQLAGGARMDAAIEQLQLSQEQLDAILEVRAAGWACLGPAEQIVHLGHDPSLVQLELFQG